MHGAIGAKNDGGATVVAGEREMILIACIAVGDSAETPVSDLDEAVASLQNGGAGAILRLKVNRIDWDGSRAESDGQNAKNRKVLHFECSTGIEEAAF